MSGNTDTYIASEESQTETRTRKILIPGGRIKVQEQSRTVKLQTVVTITTSNGPSGQADATYTGAMAVNSVVSSRVDWNPITGKQTKTNVVCAAVGSWTNGNSYYIDTDDGASQQSQS